MPASNVWDQRCTSDNCKNWVYAADSDVATKCTECWANSDIDTYLNFDGKGSYSEQELSGRNTTEPFTKNSDQCVLQCGIDYWSNWGSTHAPTTNV